MGYTFTYKEFTLFRGMKSLTDLTLDPVLSLNRDVEEHMPSSLSAKLQTHHNAAVSSLDLSKCIGRVATLRECRLSSPSRTGRGR
jgi:hypothetical protein